MKNLLPLLILFCGLITMSSSCNKKIKNKVSEPEVEQEITDIDNIAKPEMTPHSMEKDCHGVRKTIRTVSEKEGEIMIIGNNIIISTPPGTKRYKVCEIDVSQELKTEGLKVRFSGEILEIFHNERLMGTPTRLTSIEVIK